MDYDVKHLGILEINSVVLRWQNENAGEPVFYVNEENEIVKVEGMARQTKGGWSWPFVEVCVRAHTCIDSSMHTNQ